jgi:hypothetical protein
MGVLMGQDSLERATEHGQRYGIGRRARGHEPHLGIGIQKGAHGVRRLPGEVITTIAAGRALIGSDQGV